MPLLVSPNLLRKYGVGQIDVAYYNRGVIYIKEIKSRDNMSKKQLVRLKGSATLLGYIFDCPVMLENIIVNSKKY